MQLIQNNIRWKTDSALYAESVLSLFPAAQPSHYQHNQHNDSDKAQHGQQHLGLTGYTDNSWAVSAANDAERS